MKELQTLLNIIIFIMILKGFVHTIFKEKTEEGDVAISLLSFIYISLQLVVWIF